MGSKLFQHHVPSFILKKLASASPSSGRVISTLHVKSGAITQERVDRVGGVDNQYDLSPLVPEQDLDPNALELFFRDLEGLSAPIIKRLTSNSPSFSIDIEEREILCTFIAAQYIRVPGFKIRHENYLASFARGGIIPINGLVDKALDNIIRFGIPNQIAKLARIAYNRPIHLVKAIGDRRFVIGDNPVIITHDPFVDLPQNVFIAFEISISSSSIFFPLSHSRAIFMGPREGVLNQNSDGLDKTISLNDVNTAYYNKLQRRHADMHVFAKRGEDLSSL